jgi:hypothetical protein
LDSFDKKLLIGFVVGSLLVIGVIGYAAYATQPDCRIEVRYTDRGINTVARPADACSGVRVVQADDLCVDRNLARDMGILREFEWR